MPNKPGTSLVSGATEVVTEQKPVQLSTTVTGTNLLGVFVTCDPSNTGTICTVGGSKAGTEAKKELGKVKGIVLEKKQPPVFIEVTDLSTVWVDVEKGKDIVTWTAVLA